MSLSLVAVASTAPQLTHTQSQAVGNAVSAILRDKVKKKKQAKTKTCSFFLELRSVRASLELLLKKKKQ